MRNKYRRKSGIGIISIMVLCICGIVVFKSVELNNRKINVKSQTEELEKKIKAEEDKSKEIQNYSAYIETKGYIEEIAREKLGLVYEEEILIIPSE
ncbi:MAG TPA: septum formation initiator family protein [Clostridiales bacterium]|nr:septum formation initiator family protein [Clostridiales bacterium]